MITDAFSRKIMGFSFRNDLLTQGCVDALQMALSNRQYKEEKLIHHSDRGSQYCCKDYIDLLGSAGVSVSMTENGDPYENALAERMNGILKNEFNLYSSVLGFDDTYQLIRRSIDAYNGLRPHSSCDYLTPIKAHNQTMILKKRWKKNKTTNYNHANFTKEGAGGGSLKSKTPGPYSKKEHDDQKNPDLSPLYSAQQNLR